MIEFEGRSVHPEAPDGGTKPRSPPAVNFFANRWCVPRSSAANLNTAVQFPSAKIASPWDDVAAIYRRICLLRCRGESMEAARLTDHELPRALAKITPVEGETAAFITYRDGLFQLEEERVHDALAVAELLAPLLLDRMAANPSTASSGTAGRVFPDRSPSPVVSQPVDIADMIDCVLAQQRSVNRGRP